MDRTIRPCIECISFAICKQKKQISCSILWTTYPHQALFDTLKPIFPKLETVIHEGVNIKVSSTPPYYEAIE